MGKKPRPKRNKKPPEGFSKFLHDAWDVLVERCKMHKAMRILSQQTWSVEFLVYVVRTAAKQYGQDIQILIQHKNGDKLTITNHSRTDNKQRTEELLNSLDDKSRFDALFADFGVPYRETI